MKLRKLAAAVLAFFSISASAVDYDVFEGERLVGQNFNYTIPKGKKSLEDIAALANLGLSNMMEANPLVDPYLPSPGTVLLIPHQLILPNTQHSGIIINSAEMRLYYYPANSSQVIVLPIGIGQLGKDTPVNWVTKVERKKAGPTWTPSAKVRAEYAAQGEILPAVVPAGKDNPMGLFALYVGRMYAIHGTNASFGIGLRVSHGCIRLRDADIEWLFNNVPVNTRVEFINEPIKATVEPDGSKYIEVHQPLSTTYSELTSRDDVEFKRIPQDVLSIINSPDVDQAVVEKALNERKGIPVKINGFSF
jgi:L,D-transpeptidase YbiS